MFPLLVQDKACLLKNKRVAQQAAHQICIGVPSLKISCVAHIYSIGPRVIGWIILYSLKI